MTVVLKTVAYGTFPREGRDRIQAVQGWHGGLLLHAEHGRALRRMQVQSDDVSHFGFELGIVAGR
jgi:hypothetical protein